MSEPQSEPSSALSPATVRFLILSIIVMTILIIAGVIALIWGFQAKFSEQNITPPVRLDIPLSLKPDEQITAYKKSDDGLWLEIEKSGAQSRIIHLNSTGDVTHSLRIE